MAKATKSKHEASGLTPEPLSRRLKLSDEEETKEESDELMNQTEAAQDILAELKNMKAQTAFLLAQQADNLREKARKEFVVAGWSMFAADSEDLETQGVQLETQTESRERWVKELAKKAGITSFYYRDWTFSHQTRGEALFIPPDDRHRVPAVATQQTLRLHQKACRNRQVERAFFLEGKGGARLESHNREVRQLSGLFAHERKPPQSATPDQFVG